MKIYFSDNNHKTDSFPTIIFLKFAGIKLFLMRHYFILFFILSFSTFGQNLKRKGTSFVFWGYNRSAYPGSDIHFKGPGYDFTLANVSASDAPTAFDGFETYFNPSLFSIPQFNFHAGYFFKENWSISIGWDHMKYVVDDFQNTRITGNIAAQVSNPSLAVNPAYVGKFSSSPFVINPTDFVDYEHTDGFNYAAIEIDHYKPLWRAKAGKMQLDWVNGLGVGVVVPRSDVRLFSVGQNNYWNLAGAGASARTGLRINLTRLLFFQADVKGGYTNLWDVHTTGRSVDSADQSIWFAEFAGVLGFTIGKAK
jgi:hypothetical protein